MVRAPEPRGWHRGLGAAGKVAGRRCASCGAPLSLVSAESLCVTCYAADPNAPRVTVPARVPKPAWLWVAPSAARALATRDLGIILRAYRKVNQLSQVRLAEQLGYDPA